MLNTTLKDAAKDRVYGSGPSARIEIFKVPELIRPPSCRALPKVLAHWLKCLLAGSALFLLVLGILRTAVLCLGTWG